MYFDSHAHLDDRRFNKDREYYIQTAKREGIRYILNSGESIRASKAGIDLAEKYDFIYAAVGIHPHGAKRVNEGTYKIIEDLSKHEKVVAIGEIGLDYYRDLSPRHIQKQVFKRQMQLAERVDLPIIVHDRDAHEDTFDMLEKYFCKEAGGVLHSYSGSVEMAYKIIDLGLYLSISGPITYNSARKTVEVVKEIPLEHILIETDSPYLTPVPYRGKTNHPALVKYVAKKIAEIKGVSVEEVAKQTTENAKKLFRIKD